MTAAIIPQMVDVKTLAERTHIAESTWRQYISQRKLAAVKAPGGQVRVRVEDALALFQQV